MYFDHVNCPSCRSVLDPEALGTPGGGRALACPKCGAGLALTDLFGLSDAFADPDEPAPPSLDDLVPSRPARPKAATPAAPPAKATTPPAGTGRALPVRRADPPADEEPTDSPALAAMRAMRKKR